MILFLTNAPSEILALRSLVEGLPEGFPPVRAALATGSDRPDLAAVDVVLVRLLGGSSAWAEPFEDLRRDCRADGIPLLAFGGEAAPDAELTAASTAPSATVAQAFEYLVHGGLANLEHLLRFVSDTVCMTGFGFDPPAEVPATGVYYRTRLDRPERNRSRVAVLFYRAHLVAGNTRFVDDLCTGLEARGVMVSAVWCYSLRPDAAGRVDAIDLVRHERPDALITTVLVSGIAADDGLAWDATALGSLGVPVVQAITATTSRDEWAAAPGGLFPLDVAMRVALPEFDGRIVAVPFSFNEEVDDGDTLGSPGQRLPDTARSGRPRRRPRRAAWPGCGRRRRWSGEWRSCCPPTRPGAAGSATPSPLTRPPRSWPCSALSPRPAIGSIGYPPMATPSWPN